MNIYVENITGDIIKPRTRGTAMASPEILCKHPKAKCDKIKYLLLLRIMTSLLKHDLISVGKNITLISGA